MKQYLTGSSGFIGSYLLKRLGNVITIPHDQIDILQLKSYDNFFFLSSYGNLVDQTDADKILKANIADLIHVLLQSDMKFKSFVFVSTSSVTLKIQTMYSRTKKAAEEVLLAFMEKYNAPICIIRPFSVTGVGEHPQHLIPTLIRSCLKGELVNFVPNPVHDYIDVSDVVEGIVNLSENHARGIFELGTGKPTSNLEVLKIVEKITGKKANINLVEKIRDYDNDYWYSRNFKSRSWGWLPKKTLEESVEEMVNVVR
jgi:nucleoside-diphosphate-sugar epimerase